MARFLNLFTTLKSPAATAPRRRRSVQFAVDGLEPRLSLSSVPGNTSAVVNNVPPSDPYPFPPLPLPPSEPPTGPVGPA